VFGDAVGQNPTLTWAQLAALGITGGPAAYELKVRATNGGNSLDSFGTSLSISEAPAKAVLTGSGGYRGESRSFTVTAVDYGGDPLAASYTFDIDWNGDGTFDQTVTGPPSGVAVSHTFAASGTSNVKIRATASGVTASTTTTAPITTTDYVLRDNGQGQMDLIWGGTPGIDGVFFYTGVGGRVTIFAQLENLQFVNRVTQVAGVTGKLIAYGYDGADGLIAEFLTTRQAVLYGGNGDDVLVGGFTGDRLDGGDGDSGPRSNGNFFLQPGVTVFDDGAIDTLLGGTELDWLILRLLDDLSPDTEPGETRTGT
jgi:hypothetical protein